MMKKILIAIPTARYIEPDTFKSIYDLDIPDGYHVDFQYFYGYRVDQVRNLIADWVVRGYDYLFSVDHDITFPRDTLTKLLSHDQDLVSGVYRQRLEPQQLEVFEPFGGRMSAEDLYAKDWKLMGIGGCGFGCVLVKKEVFAGVGYPQFEYYPALDHNNTISEDTDFCKKAIAKGFKLWCDPSVRCGHIGSTTMHVEVPKVDPIMRRLKELHDQPLLPMQHVDYLLDMKRSMKVEPKVIYDIGACVLHWTNRANEVWPDAKIIPIEAMEEVSMLYNEKGWDTWVAGCVLSDCEEEVEFYQNLEHPGGNSLYKENNELSPLADQLFPEEKKVKRNTDTLDNIVRDFNLPAPDMIKMDIQGAELKALKGATETLKSVKHLILELQHLDYNFGAPKAQEVIDYLKEIGFDMVGDKMFCGGDLGVDGDYHFVRREEFTYKV
jgi:FkbM family methyltransferase